MGMAVSLLFVSVSCFTYNKLISSFIFQIRAAVEHWLSQLAEEVCERLEKERKINNRMARGLHVGIGSDGDRGYVSRAGPLASYDAAKICRQASYNFKSGLYQFVYNTCTWLS